MGLLKKVSQPDRILMFLLATGFFRVLWEIYSRNLEEIATDDLYTLLLGIAVVMIFVFKADPLKR
jgi:hypothetical protein